MAIDTDLMKCSKCGEMRVNQAKQQEADDGRAMETVKEEEEELESSSRTSSSKGDAVLNSATCAACEALDTKEESKPSKESDTPMLTATTTATETAAIDALKTEFNIDLTTTEEMPPINEPNNALDGSEEPIDVETKVKDDEKIEPSAIDTSTTPTPMPTADPVPESSGSGKQSIEEKTETTAPTSPAPPPPPPPPPPPASSTSPRSSPERIVAPPPPPPPQPQLQQRSGKITRSSLNGSTTANRAPTIMKRLRKSTRSTRFKSKLTGRTNLSNDRDRSSNGHNGADGAGSYNSANHHNQGFPHSNSKSQGKSSAGNNLGGNSGGTSGGGSSFARNRRALFKRPAQKQPKVQATTRFVKSVFYKGSYMQIGDIVSIVDSQQNVYYAQIRGLLVDAYCEKSAFLTWLIPTQDSPDPKEGFDPATYLIGPDEDLSRKLCYLEFVMHAPSNYYYDRSTPFPLPDVDEYTSQRSGGYLWTRLPIVKREKRVNNSNNC